MNKPFLFTRYKPLKQVLFKKIIKLLELPESSFDEKIGDYYTSLATDKRFIMLEDGTWDLRSRHTSDKVVKITEDEEEEADELSRGKLAYLKYDSISKRKLTCEISTGKFIVELEGRSDGTYWKYYIEEDGCHYIYFNKTKGSPCVQITREEFDALNIKPGTHHAYDANRKRYEY